MGRILLLSFIFALFSSAKGADCVWDKDVDFPQYPSLLMDENSWTSILPVMEGDIRTVRIASGSSVIVACPETTIGATTTEVESAICEGGDVLNVGGTNYNMMDLECTSRLKEAIKMNVGVCTGGEEHSIGYDIVGYPFYELIRVCFDMTLENCLSTSHTLRGASVSAKDINPDRPSFKVDSGFYTVSANTCYEQASQITLMDEILGDSSVIDVSNSLYFARGHMAPDSDFLTEMEADATYYYINAAPQWQSFNNGNWKYMEVNVRELAEIYGSDFWIYTGTYNILELEDINANLVEIYLGLTENEAVIPAPDVTWKVIYEPLSVKGVAIIGSNNPYLTALPNPFCTDVCDQLTSWLTFDVEDIAHGATFCCYVDDFAAVVPNAPDLGSPGLLTG